LYLTLDSASALWPTITWRLTWNDCARWAMDLGQLILMSQKGWAERSSNGLGEYCAVRPGDAA
ncbi:hypothetical protein SB717_38575, partial [Priestia sp. SIMBA_032]|uniref:hypothetical protein n=1 Tax=Priestia sp. SIMBA_032 TaxID=3085775 RepID=UPI00397C4733